MFHFPAPPCHAGYDWPTHKPLFNQNNAINWSTRPYEQRMQLITSYAMLAYNQIK